MNKYDTFWPRVGAGLIDGIIFSLIGLWERGHVNEHTSQFALSCWSLFNAWLPIGYSVAMHYSSGQTVGKIFLGIRVQDVSEARGLTFWQACLRDVGPIVMQLIALGFWLVSMLAKTATPPIAVAAGLGSAAFLWFLIEIVTMLTNPKRRALHDFIARTVVIREMPNQASEPTVASVTPPAGQESRPR